MPTTIKNIKPVTKAILIRAIKCRMFLHTQGFLSEKENDTISKRLRKFQDKNNIEVTREEIYGK